MSKCSFVKTEPASKQGLTKGSKGLTSIELIMNLEGLAPLFEKENTGFSLLTAGLLLEGKIENFQT